MRVDFPAPLSPTTPKHSPACTFKSTFSKAVIVPKYLVIPYASNRGLLKVDISYEIIKKSINCNRF